MKLEGSCHCRAVTFTVESHTPYPYMRCFCSICRKTAGAGGFAINIMGEKRTLRVSGRKSMSVYRARMEDGSRSEGRRHFCRHCGSALYLTDPQWPDGVWPLAGAIDTPLPKAPENVNILLDSAAPWCPVPRGKTQTNFDGYPSESIAGWHEARGLTVE